MKLLQKLSKQLSSKALLSPQELAQAKGGRRYITQNAAIANSLCNSLMRSGFSPRMDSHDGKYCIEW